jgi:hypothetical protein
MPLEGFGFNNPSVLIALCTKRPYHNFALPFFSWTDRMAPALGNYRAKAATVGFAENGFCAWMEWTDKVSLLVIIG